MKRILFALVTTIWFVSSACAQAPMPANSVGGQLQAIQAANKAIIEQQNKTLQTLEEMKQAAEQIKTFAKRG